MGWRSASSCVSVYDLKAAHWVSWIARQQIGSRRANISQYLMTASILSSEGILLLAFTFQSSEMNPGRETQGHTQHTITKTTLRNRAVELLTEATERCTFLTGLGVGLGKIISGVVDVDSAQVLCVLADLHDEHLVFEETVGHMVVASNNYLRQQRTRETH
jgi:hypothetical protein